MYDSADNLLTPKSFENRKKLFVEKNVKIFFYISYLFLIY